MPDGYSPNSVLFSSIIASLEKKNEGPNFVTRGLLAEQTRVLVG